MAFTLSDLDKLPPAMRREARRQLEAKPVQPAKAIRTLTIVLDLPPRELSPNARCHYMQVARAKKRYRQHARDTALLMFLPAGGPRWSKAKCRCVFHHARKARRDGDNLLASMKAAFDGLTDAGVWADDAGVTHEPVVQLVDPETPRVTLVVEAL